ncbi:hypothetical protein KP509_1Z322200 [Ceratopteris richardii]|nr:hypothetical protein KP509_1Z322200 [Ceratopteris richardii]
MAKTIGFEGLWRTRRLGLQRTYPRWESREHGRGLATKLKRPPYYVLP